MFAPVALLVALALASDPPAPARDASDTSAPAAGSDAPTIVLPSTYGETVVGVRVARGSEWASGMPHERAWAGALVADAYLRDVPLALRVALELGDGAGAEIGAKVLLPALGPVRAFGALCAGGALRSGATLGSASAAAGVDARVGRRLVLSLEVEARTRWDPEGVETERYRTAALGGISFVF